MKRIREQIEAYMRPGVTGDGRPMAEFKFPPDFIGFQGHFPAKSILPGACQIQCLLTLLEHVSGKALALKEIVLAKYVVPVLPDELVSCVPSEAPDFSGAETTVKAIITRNGERVSELRIRVGAREVSPS